MTDSRMFYFVHAAVGLRTRCSSPLPNVHDATAVRGFRGTTFKNSSPRNWLGSLGRCRPSMRDDEPFVDRLRREMQLNLSLLSLPTIPYYERR
jgi:hypothetical protein